jgi:hypothetical protein
MLGNFSCKKIFKRDEGKSYIFKLINLMKICSSEDWAKGHNKTIKASKSV